ncbi:MAG: hypothetical protein SVV80_11870 [Planctomycetota bacterium]|nr:hypothetical protein [Planctomycetota bacterium]
MESIKTHQVGIGILMLILLVAAGPAGADVRIWDGGGADNDWATPGNWDPDGYADSNN